MLSKELLYFCEDHAISIKKFLNDNFQFSGEERKINSKKRKWRIRHSEISYLPFVVPCSLKFAMRYVELVEMGKILIVVDEFGKYTSYINPKIIIKSMEQHNLEEELSELSKPFNSLSLLESKVFEKKNILGELEDIKENLRIIKHFDGIDSLDYASLITSLIDELDEPLILERK
ncbi:MAG: hypothetical protein RSF02_03070 [Bacilli bacterium]